MKALKNMNTLALAIPFAIAITFPIFKEGALIFALLSTMITGFIQVCIGIKMLIDNPKEKNIQFYISGVIVFFGVWFVNHLIGYNDFLNYILLPIPLILAIYLSLLIYKKQ